MGAEKGRVVGKGVGQRKVVGLRIWIRRRKRIELLVGIVQINEERDRASERLRMKIGV